MKPALTFVPAVIAIVSGGYLLLNPNLLLESDLRGVGWTAVLLLLVISIGIGLTSADRRTESVLRLDWFLPELRRVRPGMEPNQRLLGKWMRSAVPAPWRSRYDTKQRGELRRTLRRIGNSWLASPVRRLVQAICLSAFLFSFFYVCWPYRVSPLPPGNVSEGWTCVGVDQQSGGFLMQRSNAEPWLAKASIVFLRQDASGEPIAMGVKPIDAQTLELAAPTDLSENLFDALLTESRTWKLEERPTDLWPSHFADDLASREKLPVDLFLAIDPLVSLSTAIASRSWVWSLTSAAIILMVCLLVPRGFCGYICPLGTTIDLFDWAIGSRTKRLRVSADGWWVHVKYYLLAATLIAASMGILVSGFFSAIPVITRAMLFVGEPVQSGVMRGWHLVPTPNLGQWVSIGLFILVLMLGFLRPRFWCKYVCPSGAIFSLGNLLRMTERKVESSCIHCNKCVEICPFDAIKPDFTTRGTDCTMCQSCGGVCPTHAIKFVERWNVVELKVANDPPTGETAIGRRGFLSLASGSVAAVAGGVIGATTIRALSSPALANSTLAGPTLANSAPGANSSSSDADLPVRPPGSVPESQFLEMCIRCGQCFKVCPNNVLQPEGFQHGLNRLWTPRVEANWAGCESSCNACGQVCPTGAIRALTLDQKRVVRMGLAIVNESTCLPIAGREDCDLCVQECIAAGYHAIEYMLVGTQMDDSGMPIDGSGRLAPVVLADKCVGCGLCQTRCYAINVKNRGVLNRSAIIVEAGEGKEDR